MRIAFTTLGCKINQYETADMSRSAAALGGTIVPFEEEAEVYVINTCSVTAKSDYECRQAIRSAVRRGNRAKVIVTGCYAETRPEEIAKIAGVSMVLGNAEKQDLVRRLAPFFEPAAAPGTAAAPIRTRGFLKIQDGCDNRCSYCIVPRARGRSRSVGAEEVIRRFDELIAAGRPEVVLSGIHIGKYGLDLDPPLTLANLAGTLIARSRGTRIRLSSIEPREVSDDLISMLGKGLCRHLHIPLQSGDDTILTAMKRDYHASFYVTLLRRIAEAVPDVALGADVMVGFPGEGDREFRNTVAAIESSPLTHLHVFSFSARPGTPAALMRRQVPEQVKKERSSILRDLGARKNREFRNRLIGKQMSLVVERGQDAISGPVFGLTDNYIRVQIKSINAGLQKEEIVVRIDSVCDRTTEGCQI